MTTMTDSEALAVLDRMLVQALTFRESSSKTDSTKNEQYTEDCKAFAHIAEALREREWRPIESAPKDGTKILGCAMQAPNFTPEHVGAYWATDSKQKRWTDGEWSVFLTHWSPLPEPPK